MSLNDVLQMWSVLSCCRNIIVLVPKWESVCLCA